ncbi:thioredoxin domain-containing protein [Brevundimonas sp. NPDC092305]|uniref:thioredoxin domain-containing protein n=1 Tax=Brevundimonas sp. NPDC092305 TaxID=3363957 RepID=UPI003824EB2E
MARFLRLMLLALVVIAAPAVAMAQTVPAYREGDPTVGSASAPVTLTVYLSTTCSHCAHWHNDDYPAFKAKYVDTGKVRVVYRELPTPPQPVAVAGATMARCAPADRYETVLDALFRGQATYFPNRQTRDWLIAGGTAGGLTQEQMQACLSRENIEASNARAEQSFADGVNTTPSFFINGERVLANSAPELAAFDTLIQPLLAKR